MIKAKCYYFALIMIYNFLVILYRLLKEKYIVIRDIMYSNELILIYTFKVLRLFYQFQQQPFIYYSDHHSTAYRVDMNLGGST